jgi:hypothetical protein
MLLLAVRFSLALLAAYAFAVWAYRDWYAWKRLHSLGGRIAETWRPDDEAARDAFEAEWKLPAALAVNAEGFEIEFADAISTGGCVLSCIVAWRLLSFMGAQRRSPHTRCRVCGYILKGLSEPRCPECGAPI